MEAQQSPNCNPLVSNIQVERTKQQQTMRNLLRFGHAGVSHFDPSDPRGSRNANSNYRKLSAEPNGRKT